MGTPLTDLTPLPQLLAVLLLGGCAVMIARKFRIRDAATAVMVAFPIGCSPFFLENLSYRFDVLTMVLATVLALLAVAETPPWGRRAGWGAACLLGTLCLYQPALNVFLVFAVLEFMTRMWDDASPGELARQAFGRLLQLIAAIVPYKLIALLVLHNVYSSAHASMLDSNQWPVVLTNAQGYWELIRDSFSNAGAWTLVAALTVGLSLSLVCGLRYVKRCWADSGFWGRLARVVVALLLPGALALAALGPLLFLLEGVFAPRVMVGMGALFSACLILLNLVWSHYRLHRAVLWVLLGIPTYSMLMLGAVYGNAMLAQDRYEHRICASLADDFANLSVRFAARGQPLEHYVLTGDADYPPVLRNVMEKYPFMRRLVPVYLTAGWGWVRDLMGQYDVHQTMDMLPGGLGAVVSRKCENPPVRISADYQLYVVDSTVVVSFDNAPQCKSEQPVLPAQPRTNLLGIPRGGIPRN
jgi:hypothetical protein